MAEIPFDNYNTLDYAMYRHDIGRIITEVPLEEININLEAGNVLLALHHNNPNGLLYGLMGVPRPKLCTGSFKEKHEAETKLWDNDNKDWYCPHCGE